MVRYEASEAKSPHGSIGRRQEDVLVAGPGTARTPGVVEAVLLQLVLTPRASRCATVWK